MARPKMTWFGIVLGLFWAEITYWIRVCLDLSRIFLVLCFKIFYRHQNLSKYLQIHCLGYIWLDSYIVFIMEMTWNILSTGVLELFCSILTTVLILSTVYWLRYFTLLTTNIKYTDYVVFSILTTIRLTRSHYIK